jgi:hypothetical protein
LAGDKADAVGFAVVESVGLNRLTRVAEVGPIALTFHTDYKLVELPTIADLTTDNTSEPITTSHLPGTASHHRP